MASINGKIIMIENSGTFWVELGRGFSVVGYGVGSGDLVGVGFVIGIIGFAVGCGVGFTVDCGVGVGLGVAAWVETVIFFAMFP